MYYRVCVHNNNARLPNTALRSIILSILQLINQR